MRSLGKCPVKDVFHGSRAYFPKFTRCHLKSFGFHFGDQKQAEVKAGVGGWIYRANLSFENLIELDDLVWTSAPFIAYVFHCFCVESRKFPADADFVPLLGQPPWSLRALRLPKEVSNEEQEELVKLFRKYGVDGVRYVNEFELAGDGRTAHFVIDPTQIELLGVPEVCAKPAVRGDLPPTPDRVTRNQG